MKQRTLQTASPSSAGFTLVELVVTIAVLAIALLAVANSLRFSSQYSADPLWQAKAVALAEAYSDEILGKRFDERTALGGVPACVGIGASAGQCTPAADFGAALAEEAGETRASFDDLDDFHGLDESPRSAEGTPLAQYAGYGVRVSVHYAGSELGLDPFDAKAVTLTVTPPGQAPLVFSFYRGNF
ncbi:prepilin-type N-terminal cleavage/methylation domain-containing protein [Motiliproteus sp. SC1-56]|uniref:type IV pilus modification PilV family protein n=1 Tax=Motiliproteus sp. SC1-56 TaxID=2799565 RepID=UPI001A8DA7A6|nr:prepilin-type N-terminal cleavage/methylation domain-containing protein [Motiliproteus sp. SC1-56]